MESKFGIDALMGGFEDEAEFDDPFGLSTVFTVRRAGSKALKTLAKERAKGDKLRQVFAHCAFEKDRSLLMKMAAEKGFSPVDVLAGLAEFSVDNALARLVKWSNEPRHVEYNAGNARELLSHDGWLDKEKTPPEAWKILEDRKREEHEEFMKALEEKDRQPFEPLEDIQVGDAYCTFILYWSEQKEAFRAKVLEEAAKN